MNRALFALMAAFLAASLAAPAGAAERKPVRGEPQNFQLTGEEAVQVNEGKVTVRHRSLGQTNEFLSAGYINAAVDEVFTYYENHENTKKFQNAIKHLDVEEDSRGDTEGYRRLSYKLNLPFPIGWRNFILDLNGRGEPGKWGAIWWSLNEGDITEMQGSYYMLTAGPRKTLMKYRVSADMNTWIPGWLIGWIQGRTIPHVIEQGRKDLEK